MRPGHGAGSLRGHRPVPVSYTHLDVYKRQEMPDVKKSYWYAYENNLVVVHPSTEELAHKVRAYILNPKGSDAVSYTHLDVYKRQSQRWMPPVTTA